MRTMTNVLVSALQIIQWYCDKNKQNPFDLESDSDTEPNKISKVTSIEANAVVDSAIKYLN